MKNQEGRYLKESRMGIVVDSPKSVVKLYQSVAQEWAFSLTWTIKHEGRLLGISGKGVLIPKKKTLGKKKKDGPSSSGNCVSRWDY